MAGEAVAFDTFQHSGLRSAPVLDTKTVVQFGGGSLPRVVFMSSFRRSRVFTNTYSEKGLPPLRAAKFLSGHKPTA